MTSHFGSWRFWPQSAWQEFPTARSLLPATSLSLLSTIHSVHISARSLLPACPSSLRPPSIMSSSAVRINSLPASLFPLLTSLYLSSLLPSSRAYSWSFQSMPQQCSNLTVSITGSDGKPPYRILILPFGPSPLANNTEARTILDVPFNGQESSVSFKLKYPENSQLVAVVCYFISCSFCFLLSFGCYPFYSAIFSFFPSSLAATRVPL